MAFTPACRTLLACLRLLVRRTSLRSCGAALALPIGLVLALSVQGCGFQPMYGQEAGAIEREDLGSVRVAPIRDRAGQQLHNALRDRLNPLGQPGDPVYVLTVDVNEDFDSLGFRRDATATLGELRLVATFELQDVESGQRLFRGRHESQNTYNILDSQFATIAARKDARERGVRAIADSIRLRLANFLARRKATM